MEEKDLDIISGAGGKGGSSPSTADDNLDSLATAKILDAICEGRIEGFSSPLDENLAFGATNYNKFAQKDIFLDDTPIVDADAELNDEGEFDEDDVNFDGVVITSRIGNPNQTLIGGFNSLRQEFAVSNSNILKDSPVIRSFPIANYPTADQIAIIINVPALQKFEDDGDIVNTSVTFRIEYKVEGGSNPDTNYVTPFPQGFEGSGNRHIAGRTGDPFQRQYIFKLPPHYTGATTFNLRVSRVSNDPTTRSQSDIQWFSYQIITHDRNTYPNTALIGFEVSSETFSAIPRRYYRLRGLRVAVPKNVYTDNDNPTDAQRPGRLVYNSSATWAGGTSLTANGNLRSTWQRLYTNDPAWCLYDLLINERYGLSIPETALDEYSFWNISQYNNETVGTQRDVGDAQSSQKSGTWTLAANARFAVITCTVDHKYQTGDLISITFTSGVNSSAPAPQDSAVIFKIRKIDRRQFKALKVTSNTSDRNGNCTFFEVGQEARFSFNELINKEFKAYDLINAICSNMRVMPFWSAGTLFLSQDKPAPQVNGGTYDRDQDVLPAYIFTQANVVGGNFTYEGSDIKSRATLVIAKYYDNNQRKISYVQFPADDVIANTTIGDPNAGTGSTPPRDEAIAKYGIVKKQIQAYGCTSSGQAYRLAKWTRESEQLLTETVTFTVSLDTGVIVRPGQVIAINDEVKTGTRRGGRIIAVNGTNQITVDNATVSDLPGNSVSYTRTLNVLMPDGSVSKKTVSNITGAVITVSGNFKTADGTNTAPNVMSNWVLETSGSTNDAHNLQNQLYRVLVVTEEEKIKYKITALLYNHTIYSAVETGSEITFRDATSINIKPKRPSSATITERLYKESINQTNTNSNKVVVRSKLIIQWSQVTNVSKYLLKIIENGVERTEEVQGLSYEILNVRPNKEFQVRIFSIGAASGKLSGKSKDKSITTVGKTEPPNDVTGLSVTANGTTVGNIVTFNENDPNPDFTSGSSVNPQVEFKDLDIAFYEIHKLTATQIDDGAGTTNAVNGLFGDKGDTFVGRTTGSPHITKDFLKLDVGTGTNESYTYYIKARDDGGEYSTNAASFVFTPVAPSAPQEVAGFPKLENSSVILNWNEPATIGSYAIKRYEVSDGSNTTKKIKSNVTTYETPLNFSGSKTFTIKAINLAGDESPPLTYTINVPEPEFPSDAEVKVKITKENIILNWPNVLNPPSSFDANTNVRTTKIPTVIGYKVQTSYQDEETAGEANIFPITVKDSKLFIPITAANIKRNGFGNKVRTFTINPVYERVDFPDTGIIASGTASTLTKTITFKVPPAPTMKSNPVIFTGDQVTLRWNPVDSGFDASTNAAIFKTLKYGIYDDASTPNLLFETNATSFTFEIDFAENNTNMSKDFRIAALDSGYINEDTQSIKDRFRGAFVTQTVTVQRPSNPTTKTPIFKLGNQGGLGFVTIQWGKPSRNKQQNLAYKDFRVRRFKNGLPNANVLNDIETSDNLELEVFTDARSFKEEVNWTIADGGNRIYVIQTRDINENLSNANGDSPQYIEIPIEYPSTPLPSDEGIDVIDNNVLLRWQKGEITSNQLRVQTFEIRKHKESAGTDVNSFADGTLIGRVDGVVSLVFEQNADTYTYHIAAVDTAGNIGTSFVSTLSVTQPPDFIFNADYNSVFRTGLGTYTQSGTTFTVTLTDHKFVVGDVVTLFPTSGNAVGDPFTERTITSVADADTFTVVSNVSRTINNPKFVTVKTITGLTEPQEIDSSTFDNCLRIFDRDLKKDVLYLPVDTTETWREHFVGSGTNANPQYSNMAALRDNVNRPSTHYLQPAPSQGSFIEVFDMGVEIKSTTIKVTQGGRNFGTGSLNHAGNIDVATGDSGTMPNDSSRKFGKSFSDSANNFQRVQYKVTEISSTHEKAYRKITSINLRLDTKIRNDTGKGNVAPALTGSGSYTQSSSTTITISISSHGLLTGCFVNLDFTSGGQSNSGDGEYQITKVNDNSFTVEASSSGTSSGNVSFSTNGTPVYFNVDFVDVDGVNVTPNTTSPVLSVVDFKDIPNPKSFQVLFFDTSGGAITSGNNRTAFTWQCRGT